MEDDLENVESYDMKNRKGCYFVVIDLRSEQKAYVEEDQRAFRSMAKSLGFDKFIHVSSSFFSGKLNLRKAALTGFLKDIALHADNHASDVTCLMLFFLAECENVKSDTKFRFYENYRDHRTDYILTDILKPFLACNCKGLKDKPKVFIIHAAENIREPERAIAQISTRSAPFTEDNDFPGETLNHADFYVCISRPKLTHDTCFHGEKVFHGIRLRSSIAPTYPICNCGIQTVFIHAFYICIVKFHEYEFNKVIALLQREMKKHNYDRSDKNEISEKNLSLRLWNSSRLLKKLYVSQEFNKSNTKKE